MYYVDRKSYREISSVLSISEPAVRMKFMRLKKRYKKKLSRHMQGCILMWKQEVVRRRVYKQLKERRTLMNKIIDQINKK